LAASSRERVGFFSLVGFQQRVGFHDGMAGSHEAVVVVVVAYRVNCATQASLSLIAYLP